MLKIIIILTGFTYILYMIISNYPSINNENFNNDESKILNQLNKVYSMEYNIQTKSWENIKKLSQKKDKLQKKTISFITYNIWFDRHNWDNRVKALMEIFQKYAPDFLCLQEVTQRFLSELRANNFIKSAYIISSRSINSYDVIIMFKRELKDYIDVYYSEFPTRMGRKLLLAELKITHNSEGVNILIGTSHFESLYENYSFRKKQLEIAFELLDKSNNSFLMGDFNYDPIFHNTEELTINSNKYADAWVQHASIHNITEYGDTYPEEDDVPPTRLDRIYFSKKSIYQLRDFILIGKDLITIDKYQSNSNVNTPSDHKGIFALFSLVDNN